MCGHTQGHGGQPGPGKLVDSAALGERHNEGQRSRPERGAELVRSGIEHPLFPRFGKRDDMGDQRVEARPLLGLIDRGDAPPVARIAAEAVDGFGREGDEPAGSQGRRSLGNSRGRGGEKQSLCHGFCVYAVENEVNRPI